MWKCEDQLIHTYMCWTMIEEVVQILRKFVYWYLAIQEAFRRNVVFFSNNTCGVICILLIIILKIMGIIFYISLRPLILSAVSKIVIIIILQSLCLINFLKDLIIFVFCPFITVFNFHKVVACLKCQWLQWLTTLSLPHAHWIVTSLNVWYSWGITCINIILKTPVKSQGFLF